MATLTLKPGSSATFTLTVASSTNQPIVGAVIVAVFRLPDESAVARNIQFSDLGGGKYTAQILPTWTMHNNQPHPGRYLLDVNVTKDDGVVTERFVVMASY